MYFRLDQAMNNFLYGLIVFLCFISDDESILNFNRDSDRKLNLVGALGGSKFKICPYQLFLIIEENRNNI